MSVETARRTNRRRRALLMVVALATATSALIQVTSRAEAAFPGQNGNVVYVSDQDGDSEIRRLSKCLICKTKLTNNSAEDFAPAVSPDGKRVAFVSDRDGNYEIYVMNRDGSDQQRLTHNQAVDVSPTWSPDGDEIAFQTDREGAFDKDGNYVPEIYVMNAGNGTNQTNISHDPNGNFEPAYSPDGTKIAYTYHEDGNNEIFVMNADGSGPRTNLTNHPADENSPDWSPNGTRIAFESSRDGTPQAPNLEIYKMNASNGANQTRLTHNAGSGFLAIDFEPVFSPDGTRIAFTSYRDGNYEIYRMKADGSDETNLSNHSSGARYPNWGVKLGT